MAMTVTATFAIVLHYIFIQLFRGRHVSADVKG